MKIIDLTQLMTASMPVYSGTEPPHLTVANTYETDGFRETLLSFFSHTGTHMDAPYHVIETGGGIDTVDPLILIGPACVVKLDVPAGSYYEDAVKWAIEKGITEGKTDTTFAPDEVCTRGQVVTFLWRAAGKPAPKSTTMPFTDVAEGSYCYDAVLWAIENGITKGTTETTFSPNKACTRGEIVTLLFRSQNASAGTQANPFKDVPAGKFYTDAVLWAVEAGVTKGYTADTFRPDMSCNRAQIVTFLWRLLAK